MRDDGYHRKADRDQTPDHPPSVTLLPSGVVQLDCEAAMQSRQIQ